MNNDETYFLCEVISPKPFLISYSNSGSDRNNCYYNGCRGCSRYIPSSECPVTNKQVARIIRKAEENRKKEGEVSLVVKGGVNEECKNK